MKILKINKTINFLVQNKEYAERAKMYSILRS